MKKVILFLFLCFFSISATHAQSKYGGKRKKAQKTPTAQTANAPKRTREQRIAAMEEKIRNDNDWMTVINEHAANKGITIEQAIHYDAVWMIDGEDGKHKNMN